MIPKELQPGDMLLYSPSDCFGKLIALATGSPVSHAALYLGDGQVAEEAREGLSKQGVESSCLDRTITVRRFVPALPMDGVVNVANSYVGKGEPYGFMDIITLTVILLYKWTTPQPEFVKKPLIALLKALGTVIIKCIDAFTGKTPMICSQFVYVCYDEAGKAYHLQIKNGAVTVPGMAAECLLSQAQHAVSVQSPHDTVATLVDEARHILQSVEHLSQEALRAALDAACQQVLAAVSAAPEQPASVASAEVDAELVRATSYLAYAVYLKQGAVNSSWSVAEMLTALSPQSYFITPADLYAHCLNTQLVTQFRLFGAYVPPGSYLRSSRNIAVTLHAQCQTRDPQTSVPATLDITTCEATGDIENQNGVLVQTQHQMTPDERKHVQKKKHDLNCGRYVPDGTYLLSSSNVHVTLSAECLDQNQQYQKSTPLDITPFTAEVLVENHDGNLQVSPKGGK